MEPSFSTEIDSTATGTTGGCNTLDLVSKALVADPAALTAVHNAPAETRSISEAVVLWNAGWSPAAFATEAPLGPARAVVEQSLSSVADGCLDEPIVGPRLVPIPAGEQRTIFLVFGSGVWSWRQLMLEDHMLDQTNPDTKKEFNLWDWF
ncbi:MAG: hypothetical protein ACR2FK_05680 [Sphingomicrobium sp.]